MNETISRLTQAELRDFKTPGAIGAALIELDGSVTGGLLTQEQRLLAKQYSDRCPDGLKRLIEIMVGVE